jgi:uncharacterized OsmC-like protein
MKLTLAKQKEETMSNEATTTRGTEQKVINGVNVTALAETMEDIKANPAIAKFKFRNTNRWLDGGHNRSTVKDFYGGLQEDTSRDEPFIMDNDEPPVLLGENRGANPVEFILHAAAGCVTTTFIYYAAAEGITVDEIETTVEGDLDVRGLLGLSKEVPPEYQEIRFTFHVKADAPTEKIEELLKLARMRSPSYNSVARPVPMKWELDHKAA